MANITPKPIKAPGGKMANNKPESKCNTSRRNDFAQSPNKRSNPSKSVPYPSNSRNAPNTTRLNVAPNPIANPSKADCATLFFEA